MCGIAGWLAPESPEALSAAALVMAETLVHRGPDAIGTWSDFRAGIVLAHRRLSIVELSSAGAQPMVSASGRFVITYNGELYNTEDLRAALPESRWRGHSDTEVLLEAIERWGIAVALRRAQGMFAFAVWDRTSQVLTLARDRAGEKPLYYGRVGRGIAFASELKALRVVPGWLGEIHPEGAALFMQHGYVPQPHTIYAGIYKLPPGTFLTLPAAVRGEPAAIPTPYWTLANAIVEARRRPVNDPRAAVMELEALLRDAIRRQCVSDVPLGAFLSGGIDSSTVVALMQAEATRPVRTFTIGFSEPDYDESAYARSIADHLGTQHTELIVTPAETMAVIPALPAIYDEPFADASQVPTVLLSRLARRHVTVALSGDAGDELFAGYTRYTLAERLARAQRWLPASMRRSAASLIGAMSVEDWQHRYDRLSPLLPARLREWPFGDRLHKLAPVLSASSIDGIYRHLISHWPSTTVCAADAKLDLPPFHGELQLGRVEWMMQSDFTTYLTDDILVKVDRAAMSASLETRVPLLDPRIIEFSWRLAPHLKLHNGLGKRVLRAVLARHVPPSMFERPKRGFGIPLGDWLRGPLRDWAEDLLSEASFRDAGLLQPKPILQRWREHLSGHRNWQYHLWDPLMLHAWYREQKSIPKKFQLDYGKERIQP